MTRQKNELDIIGILVQGALWVFFAPFWLLAFILENLPSWFWPHSPEKDSPITVSGLLKEFKCTLITIMLVFILKRYGSDIPPYLALFLGLWAVFYFILVIFEWGHSRFTMLRWIAIALFLISGFLWVVRSEWPLHW